MENWKMLFSLILGMCLIVGLQSCEKECTDACNPECENYDPCCGKTKADASFKIYELLQQMPSEEYVGFEVEDVATDTILALNFAHFKADHEAEYYEWRVGSDPRVWNDREFSLRFGLPYYTPIEVRLKVYKKTDKNCFPNASDTSVFTRKLYTVPIDDSKVLGRYEGYLESEPEKENFFEIDTLSNRWGERRYAIAGITPKCSTNEVDNGGLYTSIGYRSFYISTLGTSFGCCHGLSAFGVVNNQEDLNMKLGMYPFDPNDTCSWSGPDDDSYLNDKFRGSKKF